MKKSLIAAATAVLCCVAATPIAAQTSLSRVQILALQQQLRDDGCGVAHTTGRLDAMTRRAVAKCNAKYNSTGGAAELLAAMNIGFSASDNAPRTTEAGAGGTLGMPNPLPNPGPIPSPSPNPTPLPAPPAPTPAPAPAPAPTPTTPQ
jgi:hypothetical protein